ncbi:MAG TPA: HD domain-containing phosphohydrolase [Candidatus Aquilonibacter sp.]|nr:HD domain-containing phosphohydrolase [Candidatus Aquilonibacter sp.]
MIERERAAGLRAIARSLVPARTSLITELLQEAVAANVAASLFLESFFDRLERAAREERMEPLTGWLARALEPGSPLRPAPTVGFALAGALARHVRTAHAGEAHDALLEIECAIARAFDAAESRHGGMLDAVDAAIDALVLRLHAWDPLTAEHSRAVASWCGRIARALGASDAEALYYSRCGLVHDVGKARVPSAILQAPRALDEDEWRLIHLHVLAADELVQGNDVLVPFRDAIASHHERIDGSGYPRGLRGSAIPQSARIVAVADSFNAMIAHRPYRAPLAPAQALAELKRCTPGRYEPDIVEALASVVGV